MEGTAAASDREAASPARYMSPTLTRTRRVKIPTHVHVFDPCTRGRTRTCDLALTGGSLYPPELHGPGGSELVSRSRGVTAPRPGPYRLPPPLGMLTVA